MVAILTIILKQGDKKQEEDIEGFWARERNARLTRPVDLATLPYLNVPYDKFYFGTIETPEVLAMEEKIKDIASRPLLNLTGKTNTELMETYGSPNLEAMKAIGEDFDQLTMVLVSYAQALYDEGCITEAITVLEYGVLIKTDISTNYTLLADCFDRLGQPRRIETLKEQVPPLHLLMEPAIMRHLDELLNKDAKVDEATEETESFSISEGER